MGSEPQRSPAVLAHPKAPPSHQHPMGSALRHGRHPNGGPPPNRCSPSAQTGVPWQHPPPPDPISTQMGSKPNRGPQCNAVRMGSAPKGVPQRSPPRPPPSAPIGVQRPKRVPRRRPPLRAPPPHRGPPGPAPPVRRPRKQRLCGARRRRRFPVPVRGRTARPAAPAASRVPRELRERRDSSDGTRRYRTGRAGGAGGNGTGGHSGTGKSPSRNAPSPAPKPPLPARYRPPVPHRERPFRRAPPLPPQCRPPVPTPPLTPSPALTSGPARPLCYAAIRPIALPIAGPGPPAPPRTALRPDPLPGAPGRGLKGAAAVRCGAARSDAGGSGAAGEARAERSVRAHARE